MSKEDQIKSLERKIKQLNLKKYDIKHRYMINLKDIVLVILIVGIFIITFKLLVRRKYIKKYDRQIAELENEIQSLQLEDKKSLPEN